MFRNPVLTLLSALLLAIGLFASTQPTFADNTIVVDSFDDHTHWTGTCSLRDAVVSANSDRAQDGCTAGSGADVIEFAPELAGGTVKLSGTPLVVFHDVTIAGNITIDAQYRSRILTLENDAALTLDGLTLTRGRAEYGGGLYVYRGHATLRHVVFDRNQALSNGGAIESADSLNTLNVVNSRFIRNRASSLGGAINLSYTSAVVHNSEFAHNSAEIEGGAISTFSSTLSSSNNTYRSNGSRYGGSLCSVDSRLVMRGDVIRDNWAGLLGGAVVGSGGSFQLLDSTVERNTSDADGGALSLMNGVEASINNSALRNNQAAQLGGGLHNEGGDVVVGRVMFYQNSAERGSGFYQQSGETIFAEVLFTDNVAQWDGGTVQTIR